MTIRSITLKDMWSVFTRQLLPIVLAAVIVTVGLFAVIQLTYSPRYESTATLYILRQNEGQEVSSSDFSLALNVVNDCTYLLKSHSVLDEVIDELGLDMSYESLYNRVSTSNPDSTRILKVTVEADSPELAKQIVDKISTIGSEQIAEAMGFRQVNLYEYGVLEADPCNRTGLMTYALVFLMTVVAAYAVFLIAFILDDRIGGEDDIEKMLGLSILGDIPTADAPHKDGYGYYSAYKARVPKQKKGGK